MQRDEFRRLEGKAAEDWDLPTFPGSGVSAYGGSWWIPVETSRGNSAITACPNGHTGTIGKHTIEPNGDVNPSYVCNGWPGSPCTYHAWVRLRGWGE